MAVGIFNTKNLFVFFTSSIENNIRNLEKKKSITHTSIHERDEGDHMRGVYTFLITSKKLKKKKKLPMSQNKKIQNFGSEDIAIIFC